MNQKLALLLLPLWLLFACGCKQGIDPSAPDADWGKADAGTVSMANLGEEICIQENGVFYIGNGLLSYYDFGSEQCFVLCSRPNCRHDSADCVANAGRGATGFALYGGQGYYFRPKTDCLSWELVTVDIQAQSARVLCEVGPRKASLGSWYVAAVGSVYYDQGYVWATLRLRYDPAEPTGWNDSGTQLVAIDLATGEQTPLTEPLMDGRDCVSVAWHYFDDHFAGYTVARYQTPYQSEAEYAAFCAQSGTEQPPYEEYLAGFFGQNDPYTTCWLVDIPTMTQTVCAEGYAHVDGEEYCDLFWICNGQRVGCVYDSVTTTERYYTMDESGQPGDLLLEIPGGGALGWYQGDVSLQLYNGDSLLYLRYGQKNDCTVYRYSLQTGESTPLFEDAAEVSFRIMGQTSEKLIGKVDQSGKFAWITKADYEAGNFQALHRFSLD